MYIIRQVAGLSEPNSASVNPKDYTTLLAPLIVDRSIDACYKTLFPVLKRQSE